MYANIQKNLYVEKFLRVRWITIKKMYEIGATMHKCSLANMCFS
jgi:hypothetical protein